MHLRDEVTAWLRGLAGKLGYTAHTYHLAVYLLDGLLSYFEVAESMVKLATYTALHLAAKLHENGDKVPPFRSILELFEYEYSMQELTGFETHFFQAFDHCVSRKTVYCEIQEMLDRGVLCCADFGALDTLAAIQHKAIKFGSAVQAIADASSELYELHAYEPRFVALAAVIAARECAGLNAWSRDRKTEKRALSKVAPGYAKTSKTIIQPLLEKISAAQQLGCFIEAPIYAVDEKPRRSVCDTEVEFEGESISEDAGEVAEA